MKISVQNVVIVLAVGIGVIYVGRFIDSASRKVVK